MLLEVGGENLAAVPEVVALDGNLISSSSEDFQWVSQVQVPTRDYARLGAGAAFARKAGCIRYMYTASQAQSSHSALGTWHY